MFPFRKKKELDPEEKLPFCTRCHRIGISAENDKSNFCHMCGSEGTCIPIARKMIQFLWDNIDAKIKDAYETGYKAGQALAKKI
jgi:hypothetical protein